jgi:hypothetical protein
MLGTKDTLRLTLEMSNLSAKIKLYAKLLN